MKVIDTGRIPVKMWLDDIEESALKQITNLSNLPFAFKHIAIMPDCHAGYGMPIGGVLATKDVVIPNCVGTDIGCGMCAVKTSLTEISRENLIKVRNRIKEMVPVGFNHHKEKQADHWVLKEPDITYMPVLKREYEKLFYQVGTLGGGNHFIEIQKGSDGHIWIMIHSGSRNLGKQVADYYNKIAIKLNERWFSVVDKAQELAFLPFDIPEAQDYFNEMNYCVEFAFMNRLLMMENIKSCFGQNVIYDPVINIAHNYAQYEHHFGSDLIVHRKGATRAYAGEIGIIPGSQGTSSYIVEGLGNPESFMSCSHGAGRRMGRKQAERELDLDAEIKLLDDQKILHAVRGKHDLDEASGAYKDIKTVMDNQKDLVKILVELKPLAVVKG